MINARLAVFLAMLAAAGAPAATRPAPPDPLIDAAVAAVEAGALPAFADMVDKIASDALHDPSTADLSRLAQIATVREFARWFSRIDQPSAEQKQILGWLIRQPRLAPALMLAATRFDPPDRVLAILIALRKDSGDRLERLPRLTAAVCLVWDDSARSGGEGRPMDASGAVRAFRYYADNPASTRNAADGLPADQLIFVVDNMLSAAEIEWVRRQPAPAHIGNAFFQVPYGSTRELSRDAPKPAENPANAYTLANLRRFGGRLADQAYYAAQIGKAQGIPTAICTGPQRDGQESAAWVASLAHLGNDGRWDTTTGRHRIHDAVPGQFLDPQTMEDVPEGELALVAGVARTNASKRAGAAALYKLIDRAPAERQFAALRRAVEMSPSDRRSWRRVADWSQQHPPASDAQRDVANLVSSHLTPRSQDAALDVRLRMIAKVAAAERAAALGELRSSFNRRADLVAIIELERARALLETKDDDGALLVVGDLLGAAETIPVHSVDAMRLADDILRARNDLDRLANVYDQVWSRLRPPPQSALAHTTPYFAIGQDYAQLLEELGRKHDLANVRERLDQLWAERVSR